jgi:hypothetical protein
MNAVTLDEALDFVERLPQERWQTLVSIIQKRDLGIRRTQMIHQATATSKAYRRSELETGTLDEFLEELDVNN